MGGSRKFGEWFFSLECFVLFFLASWVILFSFFRLLDEEGDLGDVCACSFFLFSQDLYTFFSFAFCTDSLDITARAETVCLEFSFLSKKGIWGILETGF